MAKREVEEINASSMADIAFLLLVFFLVTSTFLKEKVLDERLPQKVEQKPIKIKPYNVLEILANKNNDILVENEYVSEVEEIAEIVKKFYRHPANESHNLYPGLSTVTAQYCKTKLSTLTAAQEMYPDITVYGDSIKRFQKKLQTCETLGGSFIEISDKAVVGITLDNSTSYETYVKVLDGVLTGLTQLRNELCQEKFQRNYTDLDKDIEEEKVIMEAIEMVFPKRIFKAKGIAAAE